MICSKHHLQAGVHNHIDLTSTMNNLRKRNRDDDDADEFHDEVVVDHGLRKKILNVIRILITGFNIFMTMQDNDSKLPIIAPPSAFELSKIFQTDEYDSEIFLPAKQFQQDLWARIIAIDEFCIDPSRKSEQSFWDTYRGRESDWYKEYRMRQSTFNKIVRDCVPFLYSRATHSLKSAKFRYRRGKIVMATFIWYMAIQSDQHTLGKEFGVRQPCVSKRIERACKAFLSAYWFSGCPNP